MRSMARWVFPVFVGPSSATTTEDRLEGLEFIGEI
jgi:hypothetical protein